MKQIQSKRFHTIYIFQQNFIIETLMTIQGEIKEIEVHNPCKGKTSKRYDLTNILNKLCHKYNFASI